MSFETGNTIRFMRHHEGGGVSFHIGEIKAYKPGATRPWVAFNTPNGESKEMFIDVSDILEHVDIDKPPYFIVNQMRSEIILKTIKAVSNEKIY